MAWTTDLPSNLNNSNINLTEVRNFCTSSSVFTALYVTFASVFALMSSIGNILSLVIIKKNPDVLGPNHKYLLPTHLSVIHLVLSVVVLTYPSEAIIFCRALSELRGSMIVTLVVINGGSLLLSACKRLFTTFFPLTYHIKRDYENRILLTVLALLWIMATFVGFFFTITINEAKNNAGQERIATWSALSLSTPTRITNVTLFFIFSSSCLTIYAIVVSKIRKRNKQLNVPVSNIPKPTLVLLVKTVIFTVCWLPYSCVSLSEDMNSNLPCCTCSFMLIIGFLDMAISWTANPLIDINYKIALADLLCNRTRTVHSPETCTIVARGEISV